jgi:dienelactone hydrolase
MRRREVAARNYCLGDYFNRLAVEARLAEERKPALSFTGETRADWERWRGELSAKLMELCGEWPEAVSLKAEVVYSVDEGDFIREKVVLDTERHYSVPSYVLIPKDRRRERDGKLPAIMCLHGHGEFGKEAVAGIVDPNRPSIASNIAEHNYDYGAQMARDGYVTMTPDSRGFGELGPHWDKLGGRDPCNVHFIRGLLLGINLLTLNVWDMMKCIDYLETRAEVDGERIGAMGLSWGGTRTTFLSALDERVKAADIICYLTQFEHFAIRDANFCGSQILPHLYKYADVADIAGLIAPRPLLIESGIHDTCFPVEPVLRAQEHLRRIYRAAEVEERLHIDLFAGGHQFHGPSAREFFDQYL